MIFSNQNRIHGKERRIMTKLVCGISWSSLDGLDVVSSSPAMEISELLANVSVGEFIPWLSWIDSISRFKARVDKVAKELDEFLEGVIQGSLDAGQDQNGSRDNFLDILTKTYKDNTLGVSIDRDSIKGILVVKISLSLYLSIYPILHAWSLTYSILFLHNCMYLLDTTSTVLEWAMTELLRHPIIMNKLQNEVRGILNGKQNIADNDLEKMLLVKAVIASLSFFYPIFGPNNRPRCPNNGIQYSSRDNDHNQQLGNW
ncbi:Cytochrome [Abeliophyllum distichum]|uniref:Cytochrome n=1 Tax=Abeliophyllum distichum TaxID=126358 RepID=A0ABD1RV21_9LAMI